LVLPVTETICGAEESAYGYAWGEKNPGYVVAACFLGRLTMTNMESASTHTIIQDHMANFMGDTQPAANFGKQWIYFYDWISILKDQSGIAI